MLFEQIIIMLSKYLILLPVILIGYLFILAKKKDKKRIVLYCLITGIIALVIAFIVSQLYFNPRPFVVQGVEPLIPHTPDNGFPSNHVLLAATISSVLLIFSKKLSLVSGIITLLIGLGRVLALIHHPIDIIASMLISVLSVLITIKILK